MEDDIDRFLAQFEAHGQLKRTYDRVEQWLGTHYDQLSSLISDKTKLHRWKREAAKAILSRPSNMNIQAALKKWTDESENSFR